MRTIVCNQAEEIHLAVMTYTLSRDYIPLTRIAYQAFGLDKNKTVIYYTFYKLKKQGKALQNTSSLFTITYYLPKST